MMMSLSENAMGHSGTQRGHNVIKAERLNCGKVQAEALPSI